MSIPSPKDFMKKRKPYRFSDSKIVTESKLNRTILEYQLDTLGSRKQEQDFEEFARKLCQYEICPNLRPQTGSTGGGDSKVDSATIPVASQIRLSFFQGQDNQNKEEFAFAFSTQKDWSGKVRSDTEEIHKTGRTYAKVFCVTSKSARDKTRATLEDELSKKYSFQVVILDRNWILDKVFVNKRQKLAIEKLKLGDGLEEKKEVGPLDYQRKKQFDELNTSIVEDVSKNHVTIKTVDNSLDVALLAAELEEPRQDVEGLFERAIRFAKEHGTDDQYFTALYQRTWTTFFWFEDFANFLKLYNEVENLALASKNIFSAERLNNLWGLLSTLALTSDLVSDELLKEKTKSLQNKLNSHKNNEANLSASVHAEAMLCFTNLLQHRGDPTEVAKTFRQLKDVIDKASNLIGFPFEITFQLLNEMDDVFSGESAYEELQEHLVEVVTEREGDLSAGELFLNRGIQHLKGKRIYKAIDFLGRALRRFYKKESKDQLVHALFFLSIAYEDAGLLWATRGVLLNAASHATSDFWLYSKINTMQLSCYKRLKTIELLLGRIGYALEWHQLHLILASQLIKTDGERNKLLEKSLYFGSLMGLLLIKTPDKELKMLEKLPDTLMEMDLDFTAFSLIYRLGGKDLLPPSFLDKMKSEEVEDFFNSYLAQPAQESLPDVPAYYVEDTVELKSRILGCEYIVKVPNSSPEIEIGEYILAALESFLSTAIDMKAASRDSSVIVTISRDSAQGEELKYEIKKDGKFGIAITCGSFNPHSLLKESQEKISKSISEIVLQLVGNTIIFNDSETDLLKLFKDEEVSSRAFNFSTPMVTLGNVLGYNPKRSITEWIKPKAKSYLYIPEKSGRPVKNKEFKKEDTAKSSDIPIRHDEIKNVSIIRQHLWDKAGWSGVLYITVPARLPVMAFLFKNEEKARAIFKDWKETFGDEDKDETIRISMVRGVSEKDPAWYRAVVTTNIDLATKNPKHNRIITVSRIHTLTPDTTVNLDRFSESFKKFGIYLLAPAIIDDTKSYPRVLTDIGIVKRNFNDRQAWEIGPNDLDISSINDETKPIIPKDIKNAPLLELFKQKDKLK
jgi:hypothetical protein